MTNLGVNGAQTADLIARLRQERFQNAVKRAEAIVLSIGANDLFRSPAAREQTLRAPLQVAGRVLERIEEIVGTLHSLNPTAEIMILGGYNPVPNHPFATLINDYLRLWDETLAERFEENERIAVVRMADIVSPARLSRHDNFHPGGEAYEQVARRIASMLLEEMRA
jgi:lysophospholipase L1-like esterase